MSVECSICDEVPISVQFDRLAFLKAACFEKNIVEGSITVTFVDPDMMVSLNKQYLGRDYVTDIISFNLSTESEPILGDIYICPEKARQNAQEFGQSFDSEIKLLMVHGLLHLLGYADYTVDEQQEMRKQESQLLTLIQNGHPTL